VPTETRPINNRQENSQLIGVPSSSSAASVGRRQERSRITSATPESSNSAQRIPGAGPEPSHMKTEGPSSRVQQPPLDNTPRLRCSVCMDDFPRRDVAAFACAHHFCRECLNEIYRGATDDESCYPPRCCQPIPIEQSWPFLNAQVLSDFLEKQVEWDTRDRTYCSNRNCGCFIRPENIQGRDTTCLRCRTRTCSNCKNVAHDINAPCADDEGVQRALELLEQNHWRRCQGCRNGIERTYGCNHIV
jgi:hypothetical protein